VGGHELLAPGESSWLARHSEPNIDAMVGVLGDDVRELYRSFLADEVRAQRPAGLLPAWRAFDRALCEITRTRAKDGAGAWAKEGPRS
jgi:hypothetical protein